MATAVITPDSRDESIVVALEIHWFVKVVHIVVCPVAVSAMVIDRAICTLKVVDAIFLAVSVLAAPLLQRKI